MTQLLWTPRGANGTAITAANAGASPAFNTKTTPTGGSCTFANDKTLFGDSVAKWVAGTAGSNEFQWTGLTALTKGYARLYAMINAYPTTASRWLFGFSSGTGGGTAALGFDLGTTGLPYLKAVNATVATPTVAIPLNQWIRLEWGFNESPSACLPFYRLYLDPMSSTPDQSLAASSAINIGTVNAFRTFQRTNASSFPVTTWMDALEVNDISMPDPISPDVSSLYPFLDAA